MNFIAYAVILFVFAICLLFFFVETTKTRRLALYITIPLFMAFSLYTYDSIQKDLGYATENTQGLENEFFLINYTKGESNFIYLLVQIDGEKEPRLYKIPDPGQKIEEAIRKQQLEMKKRRRGNGQGEGQEGEGEGEGEFVPLIGRLDGGGFDSLGEFKFYQFNPQTRLKKS